MERTGIIARAIETIRRYGPTLLLDAVLAVLCYTAALILRFGGEVSDVYVARFPLLVVFAIVLYAICSVSFKLHRRIWSFGSFDDLIAIAQAIGLGTLILLAVDGMLFFWDHPIPISVILVGGLLTFLAVGSAKFSPRLRRRRPGGWGPDTQRLLIVGAGEAGRWLAAQLTDQRGPYRVVGFVDDDPRRRRAILHGLPVHGMVAEVAAVADRLQVDIIALALPEAGRAELRRIADRCLESQARLLYCPGVPELLAGGRPALSLRELRIEDLLGRDPVEVDLAACAGYLTGRRVLVTGAAGSIGSELCRQVLRFDPARLTLLDVNESGLFDLALELETGRAPGLVRSVVASVAERTRLERVLAVERPDVVFHAAAYKHVPLMEEHPGEAAGVNVLGTRNLLEAAARLGIDRLVVISTDKAVNPASVMGASKRAAELLTRATSDRTGLNACAVRFGNVLSSRGSVVPTFARQIDAGGPVTVTDPAITRYFMTIPEAVSLIVQAGAYARPGEIYLLDMGEELRIRDLAEKMIRFRGLRVDRDIAIVYTGLRPGEKLTEELIAHHEQLGPTRHPKIRAIRSTQSVPRESLRRQIDDLEAAVLLADDDLVRERLRRLVMTGSVARSAGLSRAE